MPVKGKQTPMLSTTKANTNTCKLFDTIKDATSGIEVNTRSYDRELSPVGDGVVAMPEEIKGFTLPGASPMAKDLARERLEATMPPAKPFAGLARWYKEKQDTKYSAAEWNHARDFISNSAVSRRRAATGAREATEQARTSAITHLNKTAGNVRDSLGDRVTEIKAVVKLLRQGKKFVDVEIALMEHSLRTIGNFVEKAFLWPINANSECCQLRDGRIGIDYVEDEVDIQLQRESEMLRTVGIDIVDIRQRSKQMCEYLVKVSEHLHEDIKMKKAATQCDHKLERLKLDAKQNRLNLKVLDPDSQAEWASIDDWRGASEGMVNAGKEAVSTSKQLRKAMNDQQQLIEGKLKTFEGDVTASLRKRLVQYEDALGENDSILMQCRYEITTLQKEISTVHTAIERQTAPIKRNTTRMEKRGSKRPERERTVDAVNDSLVLEAAEISAAVDALRHEVDINEQNLVGLREMEAMLEEDIQIKKRSIRIEKRCIYQRSYFAKFKAEEALKNDHPNPR